MTFSCGCQDEFSVLHTFGRDQSVGDLPYFSGFPAQDQYLQATVPAEVYMHGRDD